MNRIIKYITFTFLLTFLFIFNVKAECSYQERKDLLSAAKNVDIHFEVIEYEEDVEGFNPNNDEKNIFKRKKYKFKLNFHGIKDNFFIRLSNNYDINDEKIINSDIAKDGNYSLEIDNASDIIKYYITFYSNNDNCYADNIITKTIKKPKENSIHYLSICKNDALENNEYCKQFIDKEFTFSQADIMKKLNDILIQNEGIEIEKNDKIIDFLKKYWYYFILIFLIIFVIIIGFIYRKKRYKL